jgi:long-chain acyl-CoA synthetase
VADTLVHAPLARWAQTRPQQVALDDGHTALTFAQLYATVQQQTSTLHERHAPATVFVDDAQSTIDQMVSFLAIISSGRCAAVSDPDWPCTAEVVTSGGERVNCTKGLHCAESVV